MAGKNKGGADVAALQKLVEELREQLAAATSGPAVAQVEAEKAAVIIERDQLMANLADVSAKLEFSIEERTKLAEALDAAQAQIRTLQDSGARATASGDVAVLRVNAAARVTGPAVSVRTKPGRQLTRYRAGRAFGPEAVPIALADLSKEDLDALKGDPELVVTDHNHKTSQEA